MDSLVIFGNSNALGVAAAPWAPALASGLGRTLVNRSVSGHQAADIGYDCNGYTGAGSSAFPAYSPAVGAVGVVDIGTNDQRRNGSDATKKLYYERFLLAAILAHALPTKTKARPAGGLTFTGTWGDIAVNTIGKYTDALGAKVSGVINGTAAYVQFLLQDSGGATTAHTVKIDGAVHSTVTIAGDGMVTANGRTWAPGCVRFGGLSDGPHTVEIERTTPSTPFQRAYVDWIAGSTQAVKPKTIVCTIPRQGAAAYTGAPGALGSDAIIASYNASIAAIVADLAADGLDVSLCDLYAVINPVTDLSDLTHYNAAGAAKVGAALRSAILGSPPEFTYASVNLYARSDGRFFAGPDTDHLTEIEVSA